MGRRKSEKNDTTGLDSRKAYGDDGLYKIATKKAKVHKTADAERKIPVTSPTKKLPKKVDSECAASVNKLNIMADMVPDLNACGEKGANCSKGETARDRLKEEATGKPVLPSGKEHPSEKKHNRKLWYLADLIALLHELASCAKPDVGLPLKNTDIEWAELAKKVSLRVGRSFTERQVYEKAKNLRRKYFNGEIHTDAGSPSKDANEAEFSRLLQQIWGASEKLRLRLEDDDELVKEPSNLEERLASDLNGCQGGLPERGGAESERPLFSLTQTQGVDNGLAQPRIVDHKTMGVNDVAIHSKGAQPRVADSKSMEVNNMATHSKGADNELAQPRVVDGGPMGLNNEVTLSKGDDNAVKSLPAVQPGEPAAEVLLNTSKLLVENNKQAANKDLTKDSMAEARKLLVEEFRTEHQALLNDVRMSCQQVIEEMKASLSVLVNNPMKETACLQAFTPWMGCMQVPPFDTLQSQILGPMNFPLGRFLTKADCTEAENFREQWQQQRLKELKLASERLRLMQEWYQFEQERLEKQLSKNENGEPLYETSRLG